MGALAVAEKSKGQLVSMLESRSRQIANLREKAVGPVSAGLNCGYFLGGELLGGILDGWMMDDGDTTEPSTFVGVGLLVAGAFMESPAMMYGGAGMLGHFAREQGMEWGDGWANGSKKKAA